MAGRMRWFAILEQPELADRILTSPAEWLALQHKPSSAREERPERQASRQGDAGEAGEAGDAGDGADRSALPPACSTLNPACQNRSPQAQFPPPRRSPSRSATRSAATKNTGVA